MNIDKISNIEVTETYSVLGAPIHRDYKWVGETPYVRISLILLYFIQSLKDNLDIVQIGPYKLQLIEKSWRYHIYVRMDYPFWRLAVAWHKASRLLYIAYGKFIVTLAVWGLAEYNQAVEPTWRDIYLIQKMKGYFRLFFNQKFRNNFR